MAAVKKNDWKTKPLPKNKIDLGYENFFWDSDAEKILSGFKPGSMDDKWFVYSENEWVYFVRSWTGKHIFAIRLYGTPAGGYKVIESWVNGDTEEYNSSGRESDIEMVTNIIKWLFNVEGQA